MSSPRPITGVITTSTPLSQSTYETTSTGNRISTTATVLPIEQTTKASPQVSAIVGGLMGTIAVAILFAVLLKNRYRSETHINPLILEHRMSTIETVPPLFDTSGQNAVVMDRCVGRTHWSEVWRGTIQVSMRIPFVNEVAELG